MIDQDGKGGRHSLAKLLQANKTWKKKMKGKIDKRFWGISIYTFFLFPSSHFFSLCQANEVAEAHFILLNPHHSSAAFSQKVNTPAVLDRKDRVWFRQAKRIIQHAIELSRACNYYEIEYYQDGCKQKFFTFSSICHYANFVPKD